LSEAPTAPPKHTNRLADETSPYLLQHAHNPVDWYPWGPEAFERARAEDKPIFLSVGYSTCYWCHVMERQSFENEAVAAEMNARFVNIKVDREERPDVDQLYMTAVQLLTRHGGWPMSVWLTPDLRPFYGGTYYPPTDQNGRPGFVTLLAALEDAYRNRRAEVDRTANQIVNVLRRYAEPAAPEQPIGVDDAFVDGLVDRAASDYDATFGGFGGAPKFPRETLIELLLVHQRHRPDERRLRMIRHTLDALAAGGIRDQLGGGFHRYSTDAKWLVPHFEIMLYDNAMLAWCYVEAFRQTGEERYARVARGVLDFVLREMTSPEGAFYTAFDAEVDHQEGLNYLWTAAEIEAVLGPEDAKLFNRVYGVDRGPNFADPHHGNGIPDKNILYLPRPLDEVAGSMGMTVGELEGRLEPMRQKLKAVRDRRKQPLLDTKILTSWAALMIRAFAYGGRVLGEPRYLAAGRRAAEFLLAHHRTGDGGLYRTSRDGRAKYAGFLDDYAALAQATLALHEAGAGDPWRPRTAELVRTMTDRFGDPEVGGFYFTDRNATDLLVRQKTATDSPLPSGNAIAAMTLLALGDAEQARAVLAAFAQQMAQNGEGMPAMVEAALLYLRQGGEPFVVSAAGDEGRDADRPAAPLRAAEDVVQVTATWVSPTDLDVRLAVRPGFHINASPPDIAGSADMPLIPTRLTAEGLAANDVTIEYPPAEAQQFAFADAPLPVYAGEVTVTVRFRSPPSAPPRLTLSYQACNDTACLPPVSKRIDLAAT
jgi:uncharacterized protein YyaL (SSP411 family)